MPDLSGGERELKTMSGIVGSILVIHRRPMPCPVDDSRSGRMRGDYGSIGPLSPVHIMARNETNALTSAVNAPSCDRLD